MSKEKDASMFMVVDNLRGPIVARIRELENILDEYGTSVVIKALYQLKLENSRKELSFLDDFIAMKRWNE